MDVWISIIAFTVCCLWLRHNARRNQGLTDKPFFSFGKSPDPVLLRIDGGLRQRQKQRQRHRQQQWPAQLGANKVHPAWWVLGAALVVTLLGQSSYQGNIWGTGFGDVSDRNLANFPPPNQYQQIGGSQAAVTILNGSPDALQITLTKDDGQRTVLNIPGCEGCKTYARDKTPQCNGPGEQKAFVIPPGNYQARAIFLGMHQTKGFKSQWPIAAGWDYHQCIYTLNERTYY